MRTIEEKLNSLNENSVWILTKQSTNFEDVFMGAKLFDEIPNKESANVEKYFSDNYQRYMINTNNHRILVISQFFGLITKTPFFARGGAYSQEKTTEVFENFKNFPIGSKEYNIFKTEQLLKIKFHAIIDTENNNEGYNILPIIFIYKVLKTLKEEYSIDSISIDQLYTYVLTCKSYKEIDEAVYFIKSNAPISNYVSTFKDRSRILPIIKNINLFNIKSSQISINPKFDEYFNNQFIKKYDFIELHEQLIRDVDYSYFLYNNQNFNINLIDEPDIQQHNQVQEEKILISPFIEEDSETDYIEKVDSIDEKNINEKVCEDAHKIKPLLIANNGKKNRYRTNPVLGKISIKRAGYLCERDETHITFLSKKTNKQYMEAHHLIPVCFQQEMWEKYKVNIDCVENLVSLCPICHKAFHYGTNTVKSQIIEFMFKICQPKYKKIGLDITLEEIYKLYNIK